MLGFSLLEGLLIVWAVVTGIMVALVIYRSTLGAHEENQLFLSPADNMLEREHQNVVKRERKLAPFLYALGAASGVLLLSIICLWLWQGLLKT
ncbi:MAG: hypothetical protein WAO35_03650 [Terriglobia bacterium]